MKNISSESSVVKLAVLIHFCCCPTDRKQENDNILRSGIVASLHWLILCRSIIYDGGGPAALWKECIWAGRSRSCTKVTEYFMLGSKPTPPPPPHTHTHRDLFPHKLLLYCTDWWNTQLFQSDSVFRWLYLPHLIAADISCDQWIWAIVLNVLFRINQSFIPCYALVCEESKAAAVFFWFFVWNINFGDLIGWKDWVSHLSLDVEPSCV